MHADLLFKKVDELEELTFLLLRRGSKSGGKIAPSNVLRNLTEFKVRRICSVVLYRVAAQGGIAISRKKVAGDTLRGEAEARGGDDNQRQFFKTGITLKRNSSTKISAYGDCQCPLGRAGNLCPHMAAIMIAWVRNPEEFEEDPEYLRSLFEKTRQDVVSCLQDVADSSETSSRSEDLDLLQKIYSKIRRWGNEVGQDYGGTARELLDFDPLREFSATVNYISLAIISAIERRYALPALEIYNRATLATLGRVLEMFAENTGYAGKSSMEKKKEEKKVSREKTARSWDLLVESFARGT